MLDSFATTGIGSLPHTDPDAACALVLDSVDIPFWPQLPGLGLQETMIPQYAEGFPFTRLDGDVLRTIQPEEAELFSFYDAIERKEGFPITVATARALPVFLKKVSETPTPRPVLKGQITGPLTFTLGLTDDEKKPLFFDEEKRELALALLKGKALWQIRQLQSRADRVIVFLDEPILSALGTSTYLGVSDDEAARLLKETADTIREAGALSAIHCCGKAHWPLVLASGVDILNFDAYDYVGSLRAFPEEVTAFVNGGGRVAWGVVPTTEAIDGVGLREVLERLGTGLEILSGLGFSTERIRQRSLLTPSCGAGSLSVEQTEKVFTLLKETKAAALEAF